jgi:transcriptional regulator with XRE-family HTH domain
MATGNPPRKRREKRATPEGQALAYARKRLKMSQRDLADRIGVHSSLIAQVEAGWCPLPDRVAQLAAAALGVPLAFIVAPEEASA